MYLPSFDGKQVRQIGNLVNVDHIFVNVTSPDLEDSDDILLGVVQTDSSKGKDQAFVIMNLLDSFAIKDKTRCLRHMSYLFLPFYLYWKEKENSQIMIIDWNRGMGSGDPTI